jgi:hypothetical protein
VFFVRATPRSLLLYFTAAAPTPGNLRVRAGRLDRPGDSR